MIVILYYIYLRIYVSDLLIQFYEIEVNVLLIFQYLYYISLKLLIKNIPKINRLSYDLFLFFLNTIIELQ